MLYVDDLMDAYDAAIAGAGRRSPAARTTSAAGRTYTTSLLESSTSCATAEGLAVDVPTATGGRATSASTSATSGGPRPDLGWAPRTSFADGTGRLRAWLETTLVA